MDDATLYELEEFTRRLKPDMVGSGIKEKYSYHKLGVPFQADAFLGLLRPLPRL